MFLVYVVRLLPEPLARGILSGIVEDVESRQRRAFRDVDELVDALGVTDRDPDATRELVREHVQATEGTTEPEPLPTGGPDRPATAPTGADGTSDH